MFHAIIFDLDDTLLDTSRLLVPQAEREACAAMIEAGLNGDIEGCLKQRKNLIKQNVRTHIFEAIIGQIGLKVSSKALDVADIGRRAFYEREVENHISLEPEVLQLLERMQAKYELFLVTAGSLKTQRQKVEILKIEKFFKKIIYVDLQSGETKSKAFEEVSQLTGAPKLKILSVGDRIDTDIAVAKSLGMKACLVTRGEYAKLKPLSPLEVPDFQVGQVTEIELVCQL